MAWFAENEFLHAIPMTVLLLSVPAASSQLPVHYVNLHIICNNDNCLYSFL